MGRFPTMQPPTHHRRRFLLSQVVPSCAVPHASGQVKVGTFELEQGVAESTRQEANAHRLAIFLAGPVEVLPFDDGDARAAGEVRAALESTGTPIGAYDVLIAGQAVHRGAISANAGELARVQGLARTDRVGVPGSSRGLHGEGLVPAEQNGMNSWLCYHLR